MRISPVSVAAVIVLVGMPRALSAQERPGLALLALPDGEAMGCLAVPPLPGTTRPPEFDAREFVFGAGIPVLPGGPTPTSITRRVTVVYDTVQRRARAVSEWRDPGHNVRTSVMAWFDEAGALLQGEYRTGSFRVGGGTKREADGSTQTLVQGETTEARPLSSAEVTHARALGEWLWQRRCSGARPR